jgi:FkbM family methyltransferase
VVDIGAGFGVYSKFFLSLVGGEGRVFAYEPDLINYQRCLRTTTNARNNSNIDLFQVAVSNSHGFSYLLVDDFNPANHRVNTKTDEGISIETVAIDSHLSKYLSEIRFCKIDVQGHELEVLRGAVQLLKSSTCTFMIEFDSSFGMSKLDEVWELMTGEGYAAYQIKKKGLLSSFLFNENFFGYQDIIFKKTLLGMAE